MTYYELQVSKNDLTECQIVKDDAYDRSLKDGELLLQIDRFSFTSNNITYAVVGEQMHYWDFFPAAASWGKVPCWGYAAVIDSKHPDIGVGERVYGYFPMASHLKIKAGKVDPYGFYDVSNHRLELPMIYNHYQRTSADPSYNSAFDGMNSIFQPLFATSFLLDDYLNEANFMDASAIWCTSASSKTSIAFAHLLHAQCSGRQTDYEIVGLTSTRNKSFVEGLGIYDRVLTYNEIANSSSDHPVIVVDFAGNKGLLMQLQDVLGEQLRYFCHIGLSHWKQSSGEGSIQVKSEFFFAPTQAEKRTREWGGQGLRKRMAAVYIPFLEFCQTWMKWREESGPQDLKEVYEQFIGGKVNPREGVVIVNDVN